MTDNTRNEIARHSLEILKLAVLEVLYQHTGPHKGCMSAADIREKLKIQRPKYAAGSVNDLFHGTLSYLKDDKYADHIYRDAWRITELGISVIEKENAL
ncbi:hypothetical protein F4009_18045 [Candidatus Poribacteria bacterium]|nr:hypothetical protein [Candidatus Poribacteria bacterium]MYH83465.1 hypothetical protein [Candidatus Poribacteria bacterium]MYK95870.1 hypothetical protein [Candidatus Poribacteria bacterium]